MMDIDDVNKHQYQNYNGIEPTNYFFKNGWLTSKHAGLISKQQYVGLNSYIWLETGNIKRDKTFHD